MLQSGTWLAPSIAGMLAHLRELRIGSYIWDTGSYEVGDKLNSLQATVEIALKNSDFGEALRTYLRSLAL